MYLGSKLLGGGKHKNEGKGQEAPPRTVAPTSPAAVEDGDPQRVGTAMRLCSSCILEKLPFGVSDMEIWDSRLVLATSKGAVYIYAPLQSSVELTYVFRHAMFVKSETNDWLRPACSAGLTSDSSDVWYPTRTQSLSRRWLLYCWVPNRRSSNSSSQLRHGVRRNLICYYR